MTLYRGNKILIIGIGESSKTDLSQIFLHFVFARIIRDSFNHGSTDGHLNNK